MKMKMKIFETTGLFAAKRAIFFNYDGVSLKFDEVRSQIHPEGLEKLFPAGEGKF
jgi:hypothetical protein